MAPNGQADVRAKSVIAMKIYGVKPCRRIGGLTLRSPIIPMHVFPSGLVLERINPSGRIKRLTTGELQVA